MSIEILATRMAVDFGWDTAEITGRDVSLILNGQEMRVVPNDGEVAMVFPIDFNGAVEVTIRGSESGEVTDILEVVSPLFDPAPAESTDDTSDVEVTTPPSDEHGEIPEPVDPEPVPVDPAMEVPTDSESEIPNDASSEQGEVPPAEAPPSDPEQVPVDAPVDPTSEPLPDDGGDQTTEIVTDPALPTDVPPEDTGMTPAEGDPSGANTVN